MKQLKAIAGEGATKRMAINDADVLLFDRGQLAGAALQP